MEQGTIIETFETSLIANIWMERYHIMDIVLTGFFVIYAQLSLVIFFEALLGLFLFTGIVCMGFVAIAAHIRYYFHFERNRKVELYTDKMVINVNTDVSEEIFKKDIVAIILCDKLKSQSKSGGYNLWPTSWRVSSPDIPELILTWKNMAGPFKYSGERKSHQTFKEI
jgi:hypothetical protein